MIFFRRRREAGELVARGIVVVSFQTAGCCLCIKRSGASLADVSGREPDRRADQVVDLAGSGTYAKGKQSLMRSTMVSWTWPTLPRLRFCLELLLPAR